MFIWWLMKRAWKPHYAKWSDYYTTKGMTTNEGIYDTGLAIAWVVCTLAGTLVSMLSGDGVLFGISLLCFLPFWAVANIPDIYKHLSKLHSQYRAEHPQEKPKRKRDGYTYPEFIDKYFPNDASIDYNNIPDDWCEEDVENYLCGYSESDGK